MMSKTFLLASFFLGCITQVSIASSDEISRLPNPFPRRARYKAALITTNRSKLCPDCLFETPVGDFHEINADLGLGKITWEFREKNSTAEKTNDLNILIQKEREMWFLIRHPKPFAQEEIMDNYLEKKLAAFNISSPDTSNTNSSHLKWKQNQEKVNSFCQRVPLPCPGFKIYNETWSADARYVGLEWFHGKFCRKFENTYPFFVQGELYESVYYEEVSSGLPAGYVNPVAETLFWDWEVAMVLDDGDKKTNGNMPDGTIAPKAHFLNIRDACLEEYNSQNEIDESKILYV